MVRARVGSGHQGTGEWLLQRITSLYLLGFVLFLCLRLAFVPVHNYEAWLQLWRGPVVRVFWLLAWVALVLHAWVGLRSVFMDYVPRAGLRFILLVLIGVLLSACAVWAVELLY